MGALELKRLLCPVDFSQYSAVALKIAGGLARTFGAEVTVLHAQRLEAPVYFTTAQLKLLKTELRRSSRAARAYVSDFAGQNLPENIQRSITIVTEDPVTAVLRGAQDFHADLIVMGTHGRTGLTKVRLGSVMESVLRQARVPVLTVGPGVKPTASLGLVRRILCPVDYSSLAKLAFDYATAFAETTGAELIVTHIVEAAEKHQPLDEARRALCDWVAPAVRERCSVKEVVRQGDRTEQILAEAKSSGADLLIVGARPHATIGEMLFGSTTESVIRLAPCPVLSVVRKAGVQEDENARRPGDQTRPDQSIPGKNLSKV